MSKLPKSPLRITYKTEIIPLLIIIASWIAAFYFYANFPDRVPSHWNIRGEIDGWSSRAFGAFFLPALSLIMYVALILFPFLDPKRDRYKDFDSVYMLFRSLIIGVLTIIYFMAGFSGLGYNVDVGTWTPVIIGLLFIIMGNYMGKLKLNWMIGNRNMWTLSSEEVWNKTNRLTGKLFMVAGILIALESVMPEILILPTFIFAIALVLIVPAAYSYILYSKERDGK